GDVHEGDELDERGPLPNLALATHRRVRVFLLDQVPLVDRDDERDAPLPRLVGDLQVLHVHAVLGIHDQHAHVRVLNGTGRPQRGVKLHVVIDLAALAQTGRVDEHERSTVPRERRVDRVPGRTGLVRHYQALGTEQAVHEARLPDVRTAHHGHPDLGLLARGGRGGEAGHDLVEQITGARADACGDWKRVAQT